MSECCKFCGAALSGIDEYVCGSAFDATHDTRRGCECHKSEIYNLQQRIAELEGKLETATQSMLAERMRADAAKAKLGMVANLRERWKTLLAASSVVDLASDVDYITSTIEDILSGTRKPLAVVEGIKAIDGETSHRRACVDAWLPGKAEEWVDDVYTLIVMPKEAE
jgi:hypothetical protein